MMESLVVPFSPWTFPGDAAQELFPISLPLLFFLGLGHILELPGLAESSEGNIIISWTSVNGVFFILPAPAWTATYLDFWN